MLIDWHLVSTLGKLMFGPKGCSGFEANPSCHWTIGGVHHGQVTTLSQG